MQKITQTGRIPISSIGLILINYLRWFKVFIVFYFVPMILILVALIATNKDKFVLLSQNVIGFYMTAKTPLGQMAEQQLNASVNALLHSPSFVAIFIIGIILSLICNSCLLVGLKHTFYKEVKLFAIFKEGFNKIPEFLWTIVSLFLIVYLPLLLIPSIGLIFPGLSMFLMLILLFLMGILLWPALQSFYIPIHFFSDNNLISSAKFAFTTFWRNFLSMLCISIVFGFLVLLSYIPIFLVLFFVIKHYLPMLPKEAAIFLGTNVFPFLITILFPYLSAFAMVAVNCIATFIAYPELLDEEEENDNAIIIESTDVREDNQNNINILSPIESDNSLGLSQQRASHQNTRPFLNEKISNTLFEKLTSREVDTPETSDTQETLDTSDKTGSQGE